MKKLYEKSELVLTLIFIIIYCFSMSVADSITTGAGVVSLAVIAVLCLILTVFMKKEGLLKKYGLCTAKVKAKNMLFYIPLALLLTVNLWHGVTLTLTLPETVIYILTMLCVGYFEEVIFRGFLFKAMAKDNLTSAVAVSSITFGIGHIINLFNGSGMELTENILQIASAIAVGFMFVTVFIKSESLILCILTHGIFNSLSLFSDEAVIRTQKSVLSSLFIIVLCVAYSLYLQYVFSAKRQK